MPCAGSPKIPDAILSENAVISMAAGANKDAIEEMKIWKHAVFAAMSALVLVPGGLMAQPKSGKVFAKVGDWEIRKFPTYCVAKIGFEGDRGLRIYSGADSFSFGFMGPGTGTVPAKINVTYWFDNNKANKFTRAGVKRANVNEDGGAPWLILVDKPNEPSFAGDFELSKSITFNYRADGEQQSETFSLKNAAAAMGKVFACSGQ